MPLSTERRVGGRCRARADRFGMDAWPCVERRYAVGRTEAAFVGWAGYETRESIRAVAGFRTGGPTLQPRLRNIVRRDAVHSVPPRDTVTPRPGLLIALVVTSCGMAGCGGQQQWTFTVPPN